MSQGNVEIVRVSEAWNTGDMDAFRELYDPDGILRMDANWREPGPVLRHRPRRQAKRLPRLRYSPGCHGRQQPGSGFSCDIAYSRSPTPSMASERSR